MLKTALFTAIAAAIALLVIGRCNDSAVGAPASPAKSSSDKSSLANHATAAAPQKLDELLEPIRL